jgi:HAD superfamily hydrolase (TIGR01509 family)
MMTTLAVIFDLDGCLVDSETLALEALAAEMRALGIADATWTDLREDFLGVTLPVVCSYVAGRLGRPCPSDYAENFYRRLYAAYSLGLPIIDGVVELLDRLRAAGLALGIATGGSVDRMQRSLKSTGLKDYFIGHAFSADQVARGKPAPDLVLYVAHKLGVAPEDCVVVEDSPHGILGAVTAGMRAIGFVGGSHLDGIREWQAERLRGAGAEVVVSHARDLYDAICGRLSTRGGRGAEPAQP